MGLYGLLRVILIAMAIWWLYKLARRWLTGNPKPQGRVNPGPEPSDGEIEVMVKDPFCGTYLPQSEALRSRIAGQYVHFCSEQCRQGYLDALVDKQKQNKRR